MQVERKSFSITDSKMSADQILRWVAASCHVKSVKEIDKATLAFLRVLVPGEVVESVRDHLDHSDCIDRDYLRRARVRIDMAAMLLYRLANRQMLEPCMFLWTDASPQWRGKEFCASSFDVVANGIVQRRLMPCVALTKGRTTAVQTHWRCCGKYASWSARTKFRHSAEVSGV